MKRVAVFGNAGGGKSTLARKLAELTQLPLHVVDVMQFPGAVAIPHEEYLKQHADLLEHDEWIIDGFGCVKSAWERFGRADTLVYVDLPLFTHFRWVTKRLVKGVFAPPPGWPDGTPVVSSSLSSYRVLRSCHCRLTPKYRALVAEARKDKRVHHLRSPEQMSAFLESVRLETRMR